MKSLKESLILELSSELLARAHDKQVARNGGKESNRSRRFATAAGKALTRELLSGKRGGAIVQTAKELSTNSAFVSAASKDSVEIATNLKKEGFNIPEDDNSGFYIPNGYMTNGGNDIILSGTSRKIKAPKGKFFIYNDIYHNSLHIACRDDIKNAIGFNFGDFEDFSQKDILGTYNSVREAAIAALKMMDYSMSEIEEMAQVETEEEFMKEYADKIDRYKFYDCPEFFYNVLTENWDDDDCVWEEYETIIAKMRYYADVYDEDGNEILSDGTIEYK